jgi:hypothetical protein
LLYDKKQLVGVPFLAEIKPVEPEEASTSVGNKRVYRTHYLTNFHQEKVTFDIFMPLLAIPWLNVFPDIF